MPDFRISLHSFVKQNPEIAEWAFGKNLEDLRGNMDFAERWNKLHSDIFVITGNEVMYKTLYKITEEYCKHKPDKKP